LHSKDQFLLAKCSCRGAKSFAFDRRTLVSQLLLVKPDEVAQSGHAARISARVQNRVARFFLVGLDSQTTTLEEKSREQQRSATEVSVVTNLACSSVVLDNARTLHN
jgi:hypothetical protein